MNAITSRRSLLHPPAIIEAVVHRDCMSIGRSGREEERDVEQREEAVMAARRQHDSTRAAGDDSAQKTVRLCAAPLGRGPFRMSEWQHAISPACTI